MKGHYGGSPELHPSHTLWETLIELIPRVYAYHVPPAVGHSFKQPETDKSSAFFAAKKHFSGVTLITSSLAARYSLDQNGTKIFFQWGSLAGEASIASLCKARSLSRKSEKLTHAFFGE